MKELSMYMIDTMRRCDSYVIRAKHIPGVIQLADYKRDDAECGDEEEEHNENDEFDRPKEDDEPEESEDKNLAEKETGKEANLTVNPLDDEAVCNENLNDNEDAGDEDKQNAPIIEAYGNGIQEEEKDDDSEDVRASVDVEYPDTPVESEDE
ncbi:SWIM-type domain-containing protein [Raphanus sativus]|nr:SWIM-type domain-containing protein [Raphanus sativus]